MPFSSSYTNNSKISKISLKNIWHVFVFKLGNISFKDVFSPILEIKQSPFSSFFSGRGFVNGKL